MQDNRTEWGAAARPEGQAGRGRSCVCIGHGEHRASPGLLHPGRASRLGEGQQAGFSRCPSAVSKDAGQEQDGAEVGDVSKATPGLHHA